MIFSLNRRFVVSIASLLLLSLLARSAPAQSASAQSTSDYSFREIENWPVRISKRLLDEEPAKTETALKLLAEQIRLVRKALPAKAFQQICHVPIWLSPPYPNFGPTGEYHPSAEWLKKNGRLAELHRSIEFTNVGRFPQEVKRMPVLLLHEVAHAYHDQILGFDDPKIKSLFLRAQASGKYQSVKRWDGKKVSHYAMSNHKEYFAEMTESFFGRNDFFPFHRDELDAYDPMMSQRLSKVWGVSSNKEQENQE